MSIAAVLAIVLAGGGVLGCNGTAATGSDISPAEMEAAGSRRSPFVGKTAPAFTLPDQNDEPVSLKDLRGKWVVLYFYPQDDTPGCACQATEFTELLTRFENMNAEVLGVSEDSPASHRRFIKKYAIGIDLLSDPDHDVMADYGAWVQARLGEQAHGRVIRSTFIIDPAGVIRYHPEVMAQGHAARIRRKLAELQRHR